MGSIGRGRQLICALTMILFVIPSRSNGATPEQLDAAIDRAKTWLYSERKQGTWEARPDRPIDADMKKSGISTSAGQWGGVTAVATYALLAAGESPQSQKLAPAIQFLQHADIKGTYALSMKSQLYQFLPPTPQARQHAQDDAADFLHGLSKSPRNGGLYDYLIGSKFTRFDHSVSQFGVLGMWACERAGAEVPAQYWSDVESAWIRDQDSGGGWCYQRSPVERYPITASMTAAGVATLFITQDYLHADAGVRCTGNITNPHIDAGLKWITDNFSQVLSDHGADQPFYTLYGIERIGVASGLKYFGTVDWYRTGVDYLLSHQNRYGAWGNVPSTAFALLFLSRGRAPIVFNKLQYDSGRKVGNWNERPRDAANVTRFISRVTERNLNWQIIDLHVEPRELHDAPILLITGNLPLNLSRQDEAKLRTYCEEGGIILGNADGGSVGFAASFRTLATRLFPQHPMRTLPPDSPVLRNEQYPASRWKLPLTVQSVSNGVREMMLLMPDGDPARWWQLDDSGRVSAFQFADDLFLYAVDKQNLLEKDRTYLVTPNASLAPARSVRVARLQYDGAWNPEPAGWPRLSAMLHNDANIKLIIEVIKLGENKLGAGDGVNIKVAHLTGTGRLRLSVSQQKEIHDFVIGGGTLIVDAAGGNADFANSAERQLTTIVGPELATQLATPLPATSPLYHLPGGEIATFGYRQYACSMLGSLKGPQLRAVKIDDRPAVFFSRLDLSAGLVGQQVDGIVGYDPATAAALMRNMVALGLGKTASIQPTPVAKAAP